MNKKQAARLQPGTIVITDPKPRSGVNYDDRRGLAAVEFVTGKGGVRLTPIYEVITGDGPIFKTGRGLQWWPYSKVFRYDGPVYPIR